MSHTYSCIRKLGRSYSRSIVGIVNCSTYVKSPCNFAVNGRPKAHFEGSNIDRLPFHKVLKLVKQTFLFEFLFFDIADRALNVQFAFPQSPILSFVQPSAFFAQWSSSTEVPSLTTQIDCTGLV